MDIERLGARKNEKLCENEYQLIQEKLFLSKKICLLKAIVFKRDIAHHLQNPNKSKMDPYLATYEQ